MKGTIKSINHKGFGFIRAGSKDYFFHRDDFNGFWVDLMDDYAKTKSVEVEFNPMESKRGPRAENVKRTDYPNQSEGGTE